MSDIQHTESRIDGRSREARAARLAAREPGELQIGDPVIPIQAADDQPAGYSGTLTRRTRKPLGTTEQKLAYAPRQGFVRRWFNDMPGRVSRAVEEGGWTHVLDAKGKNVERVVGVKPEGGALAAFLLELPEEWYREDMAAQQAAIDAKEQSMRRGQVDSKNPQDRDSHFRPTAQGRGIEFTNTVRRG